MDGPGGADTREDERVLHYAPKPLAVLLTWMAMLTALGWAVATSDPVGRLLAFAAVGLLGSLALIATVARPRLAADRDELQVGRLRGSRRWPWRAVHRIEVVRTRRLGRDSSVLELDVVDPDGTERLVVLTRLDLGADPVLVAQELRELSGRPGR
ncbi:MAG: PH domain-containing protein [Pseudonocardiaceae bacterium]